jgi:hypothetical protein
MASSSSSLGAILQRFPLLAPRAASRRAPTSRRAVANKISCIGWVRTMQLVRLTGT